MICDNDDDFNFDILRFTYLDVYGPTMLRYMPIPA